MQTCLLDVKLWMVDNRLKLNDDKTEALLFMRRNARVPDDVPSFIKVCDSEICFSHSARNLGITLTSDMSLDNHISNICRSAYYEIRRICSIRHTLTVQTTNTLVCALVLSKLDYCNSYLAGSASYLIQKLQKVQNSAARLVLMAKKSDHATPLLRKLHWLPIQARIEYKLSVLCFNFFDGSSPAYFSDLLSPYIPARSLRSSSDNRILTVPSIKTKSYGQRTFSYNAAKQWNTLPHNIRHSNTIGSFKRSLKTFLFIKYHP